MTEQNETNPTGEVVRQRPENQTEAYEALTLDVIG